MDWDTLASELRYCRRMTRTLPVLGCCLLFAVACDRKSGGPADDGGTQPAAASAAPTPCKQEFDLEEVEAVCALAAVPAPVNGSQHTGLLESLDGKTRYAWATIEGEMLNASRDEIDRHVGLAWGGLTKSPPRGFPTCGGHASRRRAKTITVMVIRTKGTADSGNFVSFGAAGDTWKVANLEHVSLLAARTKAMQLAFEALGAKLRFKEGVSDWSDAVTQASK